MTETGEILKRAHEKFDYAQQEAGIVELSAEAFVTSCFAAIKTLANACDTYELSGVCASSASGNLLILDENMQPAMPIINWQDGRVNDEPSIVLGNLDYDALYEQTGWRFDGKTFPLAQLCYIKKHKPALLANCGKVCMSTEYLYYMLTKKWGISSSAATPFYLADQKKESYIPSLLDTLGIDETKLPPILPCGSVLGETTEDATKELGLSKPVPVVLGSFDHPSAARGVGVLREGEMLLSCGTSWVAFFPALQREKLAKANLLIDPFLSPNGGCWAGMTSLASLSARIKLYVERYIDESDKAFTIFGELASKSSMGAGGLVINPLDEPDDEKILAYPKMHIARAIMEGTARLLKERVDALSAFGISAKSAVMVGGPSENPMWQAVIHDNCGISVRVIHGEVAGAVGAAVLCGMGIGLYHDEQEAFRLCNREEQ